MGKRKTTDAPASPAASAVAAAGAGAGSNDKASVASPVGPLPSDVRSKQYALACDERDPLRHIRFEFAIPSRAAIAQHVIAKEQADAEAAAANAPAASAAAAAAGASAGAAAAAATATPKPAADSSAAAASEEPAAKKLKSPTAAAVPVAAAAPTASSSSAAAAAAAALASPRKPAPPMSPAAKRALSGSDNKESGDDECVYLCGNSLGLQPKRAFTYVMEEMTKWQKLGVEGHFLGARPWAPIDETPTALSVALVGAASAAEVAVMGSLSQNLHNFFVSFYRPAKHAKRFKILCEDGAFCSDQHIVRSQIALAGRTVEDALVLCKPRAGEHHLRTADIIDLINQNRDSLLLVFFPGVQFYTGQAFDIAAITAAAHAVGAYAGWDLAHAVGNIPLKLHDWKVDFAAWCSYKYLNSSPGSMSGIFLHSTHHSPERAAQLPRFAGWWGQDMRTRFVMSGEHRPKVGAQSYMLSNPPVLPMVCVQASLELFAEAGGMNALRAKSLLLTNYLEQLLALELGSAWGKHVTLLTPTDPNARGCQLSLLLSQAVRPVNERLQAEGVICDVREPNVLRVAPTPLYNRFIDVYHFVHAFKRALQLSA